MSDEVGRKRRHFLGGAIAGIAATQLAINGIGKAQAARSDPNVEIASGLATPSDPLLPLKRIDAGPLNIAYYETGPADGAPVILLHGFPYDIHSFVEVAPMLAARRCRVIVPYLRGHGPTRFLDANTPRAGQQAALGVDLINLMNALKVHRAVLAGYDWGGRAACVAAALWPERCSGLVSVNSYLIQDIAKAALPLPSEVESGLWYQYYFQTERGRVGLSTDRRGLTKVVWTRNSPNWRFDDPTLSRSVAAFDNPDYVEIVIHSYRHRLGLAPGYPEYEDVEKQLAVQPAISVPTITMDGASDGVIPATDGSSSASKFTGHRSHRVIPRAGHNLPQEAPVAFADAVMALV